MHVRHTQNELRTRRMEEGQLQSQELVYFPSEWDLKLKEDSWTWVMDFHLAISCSLR